VVVDATDNDIFCGKDKSFDRNKGNRQFHDLIISYSMAYRAAAEIKTMKMDITKEIVNVLKNRFSRFLSPLDKQGRMWEELNEQKARDKISHALRYAISNQSSFNEDASSRSSGTTTSGSTARKTRSCASSIVLNKTKKNQRPLAVPLAEEVTSRINTANQTHLFEAPGNRKQDFVDKGNGRYEEHACIGYSNPEIYDECSTTSLSISALAHFPSLMLGDDIVKSEATISEPDGTALGKHLPNEICFDSSIRSNDLNMLLNEPLDDFDWLNDEMNGEFLPPLPDDVNEVQSFMNTLNE
jgi:hypothetical protein